MLSRLKLGPKLALLGVLLLLPLAFTTTVLVRRWSAEIMTADHANAGLAYARALRNVFEPLTAHRGAAALLATGDAGAAAALDASEAKLGAALAALAELDHRVGPALHTGGRADQLARDWAALASGYRTMSPADSRNAHVQLVDQLLALNQFVLNSSGLALDDRPETRHLIAVVVGELLPLTNSVGASRSSAALAAGIGHLEGSQRDDLLTLIIRAEVQMDVVGVDLQNAIDVGDPRLAGLQRVERGFLDELGAFRKLLREQVLDPPHISIAPREIMSAGARAKDASLALYDAASPLLETLMAERSRASYRLIVVTLATTLFLTLFALVCAWRVRRSLVQQLGAARDAFQHIAAGDFSTRLAAETADEAGQVITLLASMQTELKSRIERDALVAAENARIRTALDKVATGAMLVDSQDHIIYINEALAALFHAKAGDIRAQHPSFDPAALVGTSIAAIYRVPANLDSTHVDQIRFGVTELQVVATPIKSPSGERLGTVVQWIDRSAEASTFAEVQFVVSAANEGDLTRRIRLDDKTGFFEKLAVGLNSLLDTNGALVQDVKTAARTVRSGAEEIAQGNANLSERTEQQASSLEETASSMEQMTATVRANADSATQANQLAAAARAQAETGGVVVTKAVAAMQGINTASRKIADIIGVIDEIAFQTNLLALNAAVEAARAGEQGRGFAVVASEVRTLASRSAEAAKEIKALIQDSVNRVSEGSKLVDQSGQTLVEIVTAVKKVTDIVSEIASASHQQAAGIDEVNKAITGMDEMTQQNAALVEEAAAAAESLVEQAQQLDSMMHKYKVKDEDEHGQAWIGSERRRDALWLGDADQAGRNVAAKTLRDREAAPERPAAPADRPRRAGAAR
jgi:methyl-accepting chemotaxis protein